MASEQNQSTVAASGLGAASAEEGEPCPPSSGGEVNLTDVTLSVMNRNDKRDEDFEDASSVDLLPAFPLRDTDRSLF